jgi:hypothetical protein
VSSLQGVICAPNFEFELPTLRAAKPPEIVRFDGDDLVINGYAARQLRWRHRS